MNPLRASIIFLAVAVSCVAVVLLVTRHEGESVAGRVIPNGPLGSVRIAYYDEMSEKVLTVNPDGTDRKAIAEGIEWSTNSSVTSDGRYLVFESGQNMDDELSSVVIAATDGSELREIPAARDPIVSADGSTLGFTRRPGHLESAVAYVGPIDGEAKKIADGMLEALSPDGSRAILDRWTAQGDLLTVAAKVADGHEEPIGDKASRGHGFLDQSPDGNWIAFEPSGGSSSEIHLWNLETRSGLWMRGNDVGVGKVFAGNDHLLLWRGAPFNAYLVSIADRSSKKIRTDGQEMRLDGHDAWFLAFENGPLGILDPESGASRPIRLDAKTLGGVYPESVLPSGRVMLVSDGSWSKWAVDTKTGEAIDTGIMGPSFVFVPPSR